MYVYLEHECVLLRRFLVIFTPLNLGFTTSALKSYYYVSVYFVFSVLNHSYVGNFIFSVLFQTIFRSLLLSNCFLFLNEILCHCKLHLNCSDVYIVFFVSLCGFYLCMCFLHLRHWKSELVWCKKEVFF
jgi:hypothetical protein